MGFTHEYPYTNFHEMNADYLLKRLAEIEAQIKNIKEEIEGDVLIYVQSVLAPYEQELNNLITQVNNLQITVTSTLNAYDLRITQFENLVNNQIAQIRLDLVNSIEAVNSLTDTKIENNNIWLLGEISRNIGTLFMVLNPFTGEVVPIQDMIDYLSAFHVTDGIDYDTMNTRALSYNDFNALNITYTDLLLHGNTLYV